MTSYEWLFDPDPKTEIIIEIRSIILALQELLSKLEKLL